VPPSTRSPESGERTAAPSTTWCLPSSRTGSAAGSLRRASRRGAPPPAAGPVNLRQEDERGPAWATGCRWCPSRCRRGHATRAARRRGPRGSDAMKRAGIADLVDGLSVTGGIVPARAQSWLLALARRRACSNGRRRCARPRSSLATSSARTLPGPPVPLHALGHGTGALPLVPLGFETGLNVAVFTYNRVLHMGLVADGGVNRRPRPLRDHIRAAHVDLCRAAGVKAGAGPRRRGPARDTGRRTGRAG